MLKLAEHVAPTDSTVLIQGESGTGKEVVARYIHNLSSRTEGPFLSINCGALPGEPARERAVRPREGLASPARCGTSRASSPRRGAARFFLDEVGEMPPSLQVKLLRVLQEREVIPVGATEAIPVDVRIIAATNRDLEEEIRRGQLPLRPLLPPQRHRAAPAAAARAPRRPAAADRAVPRRSWRSESGEPSRRRWRRRRSTR